MDTDLMNATGGFLNRILAYSLVASDRKHIWVGEQYAFDSEDFGPLDAPCSVPAGSTVGKFPHADGQVVAYSTVVWRDE